MEKSQENQPFDNVKIPNVFDLETTEENKKIFREKFDRTKYFFSMANDLDAEVKFMPNDFHKRYYKFAGKYKELEKNAPGLFLAALNGQLYSKQVGEITQSFVNGKGDLEKTLENMIQFKQDFNDSFKSTVENYFKEQEEKEKKQTTLTSNP